MREITATGIIESYNPATGRFTAIIETRARIAMEAMREFVGDKQWRFTFGKFYSGRSTGKDSQNHHIWGHCQQIAVATGIDIDTVHLMAEVMAISWGYPFDPVKQNNGRTVKIPWSETRINTKHAGILIEVLHWWASEVGAELIEGEDD